jgi:hypothetical protein
MQNLGNIYICGSPFVMSRTDAQNGLDMVFKFKNFFDPPFSRLKLFYPPPIYKGKTSFAPYHLPTPPLP